ncbi:Trypanosome variant surface glycoprotein (A-type) [Trypanosoma brucei equiperdum]|uniref:Trypanosome variant surface glycoprotein (A-type) n=1 Tax=Trypanosoma brucei equiperdum TaxID=630700 RepID=A0A3L6KSD2_9TRYP|nr:Trypanosome variant surface glycoprotein (A-type) [Trypanosoma brucei equiperdum]
MKPRLKVVALVLVFGIAVEKTRAAKNPLKASQWTPICEIAVELAKTPRRAMAIVSERNVEATATDLLSKKLQLWSLLITDEPKTAAMAAMTAALSKKVSHIRQRLANESPNMITAAATTGELRGTIAETFSALKLNNGDGSTTYCLANEQGNAADHANPILDKCKYTTEALNSNKTKLDSAIVNSHGFAKLTTATYTLTANSNGDNKCGMFTGGNSGNSPIGTGQRPLMTAGLWQVTGNDVIQRLALDNIQPSGQRQNSNLAKAAHYDAVWGGNLEEVTVYTSDEGRLTAEATTTAASNILAANMKHDANKDAAGKIDKTASEAISNLFTKPANAAKQLIATINGKEVEYPRQGKGKQVKLSNVQDAEHMDEIINYYITAISKEITNLKQKEQTAKECEPDYRSVREAEAVCNNLDDPEKCNADKQCSYETESDGTKKCKYNETKAKEKGVPVTQTQTTGGTEPALSEKCKGKLEPDCTKAPECKWENNSRKDSSFLVNKKLALSMATSFSSLVAF